MLINTRAPEFLNRLAARRVFNDKGVIMNNPETGNQPKQASGQSQQLRPAQTDRRYYWFLVMYLVLLSALGSFVNDMYTPALPEMARYFHCTTSHAQLSLTFGMIGLGIGQLLMGPISDHYGRKIVLVVSLIVFIVGAVASVFSTNLAMFLFFRFIQGTGAAGGYFLARTIPADIYHGRGLAKLMALIGAVNGIAPASAPVLGGVIADHGGWKMVFLVLAAFAFIVLCISPKLKESLYKQNRTTLPWYKTLPGYIRLMKDKHFMVHISLKGCTLGLLFSYISAAPFILETHYGFSQTMYGIIIGLNSIAVAAGSMVSLRFHPFKNAVIFASAILVPSIIVGACALWHIHSFLLFEICTVTMLFGGGMIFSVSNTLAMNEGRTHAGEASALLGLAGYVVGAVVAPLVGLGNILHSTATVYIVLLVLLVIFSIWTYRLKSDLNQ